MSIHKWIHRSSLLLLALAIALIAFDFASGKLARVSLQIHHLSAPDVDLHIEGQAGSRSAIRQTHKHTQYHASPPR